VRTPGPAAGTYCSLAASSSPSPVRFTRITCAPSCSPGRGVDMEIAGNTLAERQPGDVDPYGMQVARMDSRGGWIGTAADLLRVAVRGDGFDTVPGILNPATVTTMTTP
jgi:hypothetical protein